MELNGLKSNGLIKIFEKLPLEIKLYSVLLTDRQSRKAKIIPSRKNPLNCG